MPATQELQELYDSIFAAIEPSLITQGIMPSIQALLRIAVILATTTPEDDLEWYLQIALSHYFRAERRKAQKVSH